MAVRGTDWVRINGVSCELGRNRAATRRIATWHRRSIHPVDDDRHFPDRECATTSDAAIPDVTIGRRIGSRIPEILAMIPVAQQTAG